MSCRNHRAESLARHFLWDRGRSRIVEIAFVRRFEDSFARLLIDLLVGPEKTAPSDKNYRQNCKHEGNPFHSD
jgi:hypothetical protein